MNQNRVIKLSFIVVIVSFLLSTALSIGSLHYMALRNQQELNRVLAAQIYDTISIELSEPVVIARTMANDRFLIDMLEKEDQVSEEEAAKIIEDFLLGIRNGFDHESSFLVSEKSRRYYTYSGIYKIIDPENDVRDSWYPKFISSIQDYDLDVDIDQTHQNTWTVFVDAKINNKRGDLLGVCGVGFHMKKSQELFNSLEEEYNVKINLVDPNHLVQVDSDLENIQKVYLDDIDLEKAYSNEYIYQDLGGGRYAVVKYLESMDWFLVIRSNGTQIGSQYLGVILLNVLLFGLVMGILVFETRKIMRKTNDLTDASFRDKNTGLLNRRAFEEDKNSMNDKPLHEDLVYLIADVNGLKAANDTIGHHAGDELINGAASCLTSVLSDYGKIYRIGGDEFAAILNIPKDKLKDVQMKLDKAFNEWSGEEVKELSVSCGYAVYREHPSESLSGLSKIADELMYNAKEQYYVSSGKDRRRR